MNKGMKLGAVLVLPLVGLLTGCVSSGCVKFDTLTVGTPWGSTAGHSAGTVVHTEDAISVSVQDFRWPSGGTFGDAYVAAAFFGTGQSIRTDNINLEFDFTGLSFTPTYVTLLFRDTGGFENLSVNGGAVTVGELVAGTSGSVIWNVFETPIAGGRDGAMAFNGTVNTLRIGGQEFLIDSVCAFE